MNDAAVTPSVGAEGLGDPKIEAAWRELMAASHGALLDMRAAIERADGIESRERFNALRTHQAILRLRDRYRRRAMRNWPAAAGLEGLAIDWSKDGGAPHG